MCVCVIKREIMTDRERKQSVCGIEPHQYTDTEIVLKREIGWEKKEHTKNKGREREREGEKERGRGTDR